MEKSMLTVAYELLKQNGKPMEFSKLFNDVAEELGLDEETRKKKIAQFYTNLSLDGHFAVLADNFWDLRERVPFDKVHIDMNDAYNDISLDEEVDDDDIEKELGDDELDLSNSDDDEIKSDEDKEVLN